MHDYHKQEKIALKRVYYTGSDTIKGGYALCYDRDNITAKNPSNSALLAVSESYARHNYVEKPAAGNLHNFAGLVSLDGEEKVGPCYVDIVQPQEGVVVHAFTDQSCVMGETYLSIQAADYEIGSSGEGPVIGLALRTVDRSGTNGIVPMRFLPLGPVSEGAGANVAGTAAAVPSGTINVASGAIWQDCPYDAIARKSVPGHVFFHDFLGSLELAAAQALTIFAGDGLSGLTDGTGGSIIQTSEVDEPYGVVRLETTTIDEDIMICQGNGVGGNWIISSTTKLWWECRLKIDNITADKMNIYCGFSEEALVANAALMAVGGALTDKDHIGWIKPEAAATWNATYNTESGGGVTVAGSALGTSVADTYLTIGFKSDGTTMTWYIDGVAVDTVLVAAANVPDGQELTWYAQLMSGHGDLAILSIDWIKIAQAL